MQYNDTLLTIAELAVALAGFASLVSVLGQRQDKGSRALDSFRLQAMLEMALRNAAFALIPLPFLQTGASDPTIWRILSGVYLLAMVSHAGFQIYRGHALVWGASWLKVSLVSLTLISAVASAANILGLGGSHAFSLYLAALLVGLGFAGLLFLSVASSVFRQQSS